MNVLVTEKGIGVYDIKTKVNGILLGRKLCGLYSLVILNK